MIISSLQLKDFRNYDNLEIVFNENVNILFGKNAQGKTNLLEAAYLSSTTKSHRASKDKELIKIGCQEAHIRTFVKKESGEFRIDLHLKNGKSKGIAVNGLRLKKASDLFGIINVIFFSPEDLDIVKRGPEERRRFMDMELCQIDKIYLNEITLYKRVLNQRNKLLKDMVFDGSLESTLDVWDEKLVYHGSRIIKRRESFIKELNDIASKKYKELSGNKESLEIFYEPNVKAEEFKDILKRNREIDKRQCQSHKGPHRDDIGFLIEDKDCRKYGSQGQQRSCALSLKLSEIEIMENHIGEKPVLLLDDVLSELDRDRQNNLLKSLCGIQTIMTCTGMDEMIESGLNINKVFIVENAQIREA